MLSCEFSTISRIRDIVEFENSFVAFIINGLVLLIEPLKISSFSFTFKGTLSPVNELVSINEFPLMTTPSRATFSPGLTIKRSPIFASNGAIVSSFPSFKIVTLSGLKSSKSLIEFLLLLSAYSSNFSPIWKKTTTAKASTNSPIANAAIVAIKLKVTSLKKFLFFIFL